MRSSTYTVQKRGVLPHCVSDAPVGISEDAVEEAGWCLHLGGKESGIDARDAGIK
jgi:hypothetical protein